ncbi:MAG: bifunctional (p)ppGpp synthetase/guanosine-3',5'-bis(diphosphate) 3'-pyrophosphohydrolase [Burkholderiaceae bacterium]|nr:bifunctional (p)ppGpp synthetase/guanosine-3',5'-bis(diphosphate) 3'-pyrophosphohydrolase [Burkholderiaceae bacterium]MEB2350902.1 bifunctional (p)ppGpp synthetase/guanosine-3',5'-bis(diphosphate) 3'-pyrophosphohydrolase [Burkholderiaceae bacterium]
MGTQPVAVGATQWQPGAAHEEAVRRALAWAGERAGDAIGRSGERHVDHARATIDILRELGVDEAVLVAAALISPADRLPLREIGTQFGDEVARLVEAMRQIQRLRELHAVPGAAAQGRAETLRRMLLTMAADIRVVLLRLASRLRTLRHHAAQRHPVDPAIARETLEVLAPLANRLGLWQLKWELEDLAFRFLDPDTYRELARQLEERRAAREAFVEAAMQRLRAELAAVGLRAEVSGRPKHLYSIYNKMRSKRRALDEISDLRGLRVIVDTVAQCYTALGIVHAIWSQVPQEFDDYIARPKPNGYRSLHTVVLADDGRPLEVQIRTGEMHRFAEYGLASHWRYKEGSAGAPARGARAAGTGYDGQIAWMRQLLAWQREVGQALGSAQGADAAATAAPARQRGPGQQPVDPAAAGERIYVLTPQARVIELPAGATPIDFAYHVHTSLGHRCRGARVDGHMVPLNTALQSGQTVEIVAARETGHEGPSRDWLNPQLGYVRSPRTRNKVRQWFNALELARDTAAGRERVERVLQREGRTALALEELAHRLGFEAAGPMFVAVARDEIGVRQLEEAVRGPAPAAGGVSAEAIGQAESIVAPRRRARESGGRGDGVLVVGIDSLMTQLARCCRPVPPDAIVGFVTMGHGVSVHRESCATFARMADRAPERVIETAWGEETLRGGADDRTRRYPADVEVRASDRPGLLRDITEVFARDRLNVTAVQTLSRQQVASMRFTVEVPDAGQLARTLVAVRDIAGVIQARRR